MNGVGITLVPGVYYQNLKHLLPCSFFSYLSFINNFCSIGEALILVCLVYGI